MPKIYVLAWLLVCAALQTWAGPWLTPSEAWISSANLATKSAITLLADYGLIKAPILTWPLAWANIGPALQSNDALIKLRSVPPHVRAVYFKILNQYQAATQYNFQGAAYLSGGGNINPFRTFDYQPRNNFQGGLTIEKQDTLIAGKLAVDYGQYNDVTQNVHFDDSYLYLFLGNWAVGFDKLNAWWGPGYSDSEIYSANPPPLAKVTLQRMQALPIPITWLNWLGPWSLTTSLSMGSRDVQEPHPLIWLFNFSIRPLEVFQFSLSRGSVFAGDKRPVNRTMLVNLFTGNDNCDTRIYGEEYCAKNTPGNELWELTGDLNLYKIFHLPANIYLQTVFNDRIPSDSYLWVYDAWHKFFPTLNPPIPARTSFLAGVSVWGPIKDNLLRFYAEFEYTHQYAYFFWGEFVHDIFGQAPYPYTYYGKIISSSLGSEATGYTIGAILNEANNNSDSILIRYLKLNQLYANPSLGFPYTHQNVLWLSFNRSMYLPHNFGKLSGQIGYLQSLEGTGFKSQPSGFITWTKDF